MKPQRFLVFDHNIPQFWQNRILDRGYMSQFPGGAAVTDLAKAAQGAGYKVMTADVFLSRPAPYGLGLVLTEIGSQHTDELFRRGLIPAVCTCAESPIIAYDFYHDLARCSGRYKHAFLYGGAGGRLRGTGTCFHPLFWPNQSRKVLAGRPWLERRFLVLINSNKRAFQFKLGPINPRHPRSSLVAVYHYLQSLSIRYFDPWMRSDLYLERLRAIEYFSRDPHFDLYGQGWDNPVQGVGPSFQRRLLEALRGCYRGRIPGRIESKLGVLQDYKFAVCFENTVFPGYITEKIFDCFLAGCIPIYYGAPDITDHVPGETFIDFRDSRSYGDLGKYLLTMSESEAKRHLEAAADFLASDSFNKFHVSEFIPRMMAAFDDVVARYV